MESFYNLTYSSLVSRLSVLELNQSAASLLFNWHYKKRNTAVCTKDIAKETLDYIKNNYSFDLPKISKVQLSSDKTVKFLFELKDGHKVETVLIPFHNKYSICLSSQVGCAMKCSFCYTGTQGLTRNLETSEIVGQFLAAYEWLRCNRADEQRILNIVFMGQGEPLHNFNSVRDASEIFLSNYGASIGYQKITISTSGFLPGLKRWADEIPGVNLALSLHSPFASIRNELIPINKTYPLEEVLKYIDDIPLRKKQFVTYEYLLIDNFNDNDKDAHALGELLKSRQAYINLIPFNPFPGTEYQRPTQKKVESFKAVLDTYSIPTLIREVKGDDVLAACGQLNSKEKMLS